jgi:hypothetical protein
MSEETKNKILWFFARCVGFAFVFLVVAIVGGFYTARILGLPVDTDRFYNTVSPAFFTTNYTGASEVKWKVR